VGTAVADDSGAYHVTNSPLADGQHIFTVTVTNAAGTMSPASAPLRVTVAATPPATPAAPRTSAGTSATSSTQITLMGSVAVPNGTVAIYDNGALIGTVQADAAGGYTLTTTLAIGTHAVSVTEANAAGAVSAASPALALSILPPPVTQVVSDPVSIPAPTPPPSVVPAPVVSAAPAVALAPTTTAAAVTLSMPTATSSPSLMQSVVSTFTLPASVATGGDTASTTTPSASTPAASTPSANTGPALAAPASGSILSGTPTTSGAGFAVVVEGSAGRSGAQSMSLVTLKPEVDLTTSSDQLNVTVPADTFAHSSPQAVIQLTVTLADGKPLPSWMTFDSRTGTISGHPPAGTPGEMRVLVMAHDQFGHEATAIMKIQIGSGAQSGAIRVQQHSQWLDPHGLRHARAAMLADRSFGSILQLAAQSGLAGQIGAAHRTAELHRTAAVLHNAARELGRG
jgi:hypothetical protein